MYQRHMMAVPLFVLENEKKRLYKKRILLEQLPEYEIQKATGLPSWGVRELVEVFAPIGTKIKSDISLESRIITYLVHLRSGTFQYALGLGTGISQASVSRILEDCFNYTVGLSRSVIRFPSTLEEINQSKQGFYRIAQFPNILGLIDGTQISIKAPKENESIYVCRKQYHSINAQVICGPDHSIYDIVARWPGSTHDAFIYNHCAARQKLYLGQLGTGWLLGDSGYPLEERLLTPYLQENSRIEQVFNIKQRRTRNLVERVIGTWKARFRSIDRSGGVLCYDELKVCKIIVATAVLHNICVKRQIPLLPEDQVTENVQEAVIQEQEATQNDNTRRPRAVALRNSIAESFI